MTKEQIVICAVLRKDFRMFVRRVFKTVSPDAELIWGEYLNAFCYAVEQVIEGKSKV